MCPALHHTLTEQVLEAKLALGQSISEICKVYLDVNFWIEFRKQKGNQETPSALRELYHKLQNLVSEGKIICPISDITLFELMKQRDKATRYATAEIISELSNNICLEPFDERVRAEINNFFMTLTGNNLEASISELIWTRACYVQGELHPTDIGMSAEKEASVQIQFFNYLWKMTFAQMIEVVNLGANPQVPTFKHLADQLNSEIKEHASKISSFSKAYDDELRGVIDVFSEEAAQIFSRLPTPSRVSPPLPGSDGWKILTTTAINSLYYGIKKQEYRKLLPTIHTQASLHASLRWDKGRKFKPNDFYDFHHVSAALAYCDAFFTDSPMKNMVSAKHVNLHSFYNCQVASSAEEALAYIDTIT